MEIKVYNRIAKITKVSLKTMEDLELKITKAGDRYLVESYEHKTR